MSMPAHRVDVLAIGAHPDDVELHAGGTLLRLAALGYSTGIVDLTRGELATRGTPEERAAEAAAAELELGLTHRSQLDLGDGHLEDTLACRTAVATVLRQLRPRLVLTHHRDQPHPDHTAAADIVGAAVYLAGLARWHPSTDASPYRPTTILSFGLPHSVTPSFIVDISDWAERKAAAIRCHRSQFGELLPGDLPSGVSCQSFLERVEARQRHYGSLVQVRHGEAFHVRRIPTVDDPVKFFSRPMDILP
jgi:bacillithiol biosynthesis deacetylase BshB1